MKRIMTCIATAFITISTLSHCDKDDDTTGSLTGKWQGETAEAKIEVIHATVWEETDDSFDAEVEFKNNGTVVVKDNGQETEGTWERSGNTLHTSIDLLGSDFGGSHDLKIKTLNETALELYLEKDSTYQDPDTGSQITGKLKGTAQFRRITN